MPTAFERLKIYTGTLMQTMAKFHAFLNQVNTAHNGLVADHNTLVRLHNLNMGAMQARLERIEEYLRLPWYKRMFMSFPLKPKQETKNEQKEQIEQSCQFTDDGPEIPSGGGCPDLGESTGDSGGQNSVHAGSEGGQGNSTGSPEELEPHDESRQRPKMILPGDPGWPVG
jgi:hypothetical protein